jgi:BirA family biotin operon repressor/biotin-[acetyl-CoA-carboxylase] ligase
MPSSRHVRITRIAISPRFAIKIFCSNLAPFERLMERRILRSMSDAAATWSPAADLAARLAGTRFHDVRRFAVVDSTNRYLLADAALPDGVVAVADEQTAGRGRHGRTWSARPGAALLGSVRLRPALPAERLHLVTLACAVAATDAVEEVAGFAARVKWPNDVVVDDRKLAGILAEADGTGAVVVGMGLNLRSDAYPEELAELATACDRHASEPVGRDDLLCAWLRAFDAGLDALDGIVAAAVERSATLGRAVRVELARESFTGTATRLTGEGYLVVARDDGSETVVTAGDVVHLRPVRDRPRDS